MCCRVKIDNINLSHPELTKEVIDSGASIPDDPELSYWLGSWWRDQRVRPMFLGVHSGTSTFSLLQGFPWMVTYIAQQSRHVGLPRRTEMPLLWTQFVTCLYVGSISGSIENSSSEEGGTQSKRGDHERTYTREGGGKRHTFEVFDEVAVKNDSIKHLLRSHM